MLNNIRKYLNFFSVHLMILSFNLFGEQDLKKQALTIGVLGDHYSLGMFAEQTFNFQPFWNSLASPETRPLTLLGPEILFPTEREFQNQHAWLLKHIEMDFFQSFANPNHSWIAQFAKTIDHTNTNIYIASENSYSVNHLSRQADKILQRTKGILPDYIFIFYPITNICRRSMSQVTEIEVFKNDLLNGINYLIKNGNSNSKGSQIILISPVNLPYELTKEVILNKPIKLFNKTTTCKQFREKSYDAYTNDGNNLNFNEKNLLQEAKLLSYFVNVSPIDLCPTIFLSQASAQKELSFFDNFKSKELQQKLLSKAAQQQISFLSTTVRNYRKQMREVYLQVNSWLQKNKNFNYIKINYFSSLEFLSLEPNDVGGDCFHLSQEGNEKIVELLKKEFNEIILSK